MSNAWIGKYTFIGNTAYKIDWLRDGTAGLSDYQDETRVTVVPAERIQTLLNQRQVERAIKDMKERRVFLHRHLAPKVEIERLVDSGEIKQEDVDGLLELYGYGGIYGDTEPVPTKLWDTLLADLTAVSKQRVHLATEQQKQKLDRDKLPRGRATARRTGRATARKIVRVADNKLH